jgi:uncharacterized alpha-E superfamily protein
LDINGCTIAYRTRYVATPRIAQVLELLINDAGNPRTVAFQWESMRAMLARLGTVLEDIPTDSLQDEMTALAAVNFELLAGEGPGAIEARQQLIEQLRALGAAARGLSDRLSLRHFSHIDMELRAVAS